MNDYDTRAFDRLFNRTAITPTDCFEFTGHCNPDGYGNIRYLGAYIGAHRLSYMLCIADIPIGLSVLHKCDNPPCVNPKHLFLGTLKDNSLDMVAKGRNPDRTGANNPNAKLLPADHLKIRQLAFSGMTHRAIAEQVGVGKSQIGRILGAKP